MAEFNKEIKNEVKAPEIKTPEIKTVEAKPTEIKSTEIKSTENKSIKSGLVKADKEVKVENKIENKTEIKTEVKPVQPNSQKQNIIAQQPFVSNVPKKRIGKLMTRIGDKVLIVDKNGKGYTLPNKNFKGIKNGATVEF